VVSSTVTLRPVPIPEIITYVDSGEPRDKAGAYAIQGGAAGFVEQVEGSLNAIIGLPIERLTEICAALGAPLR
jgi:septum formation protein